MFQHWVVVHREDLDQHTKLKVERADGEYSASVYGTGWSAGTGQWWPTMNEAIEDGRRLFQRRNSGLPPEPTPAA